MRTFLLLILAGLAATTLRAETPALLATALHKLQAEENRWAFTQTTQTYDRTGAPDGGVMVEKFDPSQPPDQQWTLVLRDGKPPTERQLRTWRKKRDKETRRRQEKSLGQVIDFAQAKAVREEARAVVYEVPLQKEASRRFPSEKFVVFMTVDRAAEALEQVALRTRGSFRMIGVAKVEQVELDVDLRPIDPAYAPQPTRLKVSGSGKVLFVRVGGSAEITLTDHRRVKPYDERFAVEVGELRVLDF